MVNGEWISGESFRVMVKHICKLFFMILVAFVGCNGSGQSALDFQRVCEGLVNQTRRPLPKNITVSGPNELKLELVYIEPGCFTMGRNRPFRWLARIINWETREPHDSPARKVTITKGFYIGKYEVTTAQYAKFLNSPDVNAPEEQFIALNECARIIKDGQYISRPGAEDCAVNTVPWYGADAFCKWLSKTTGRCFRLPTDAEWEFTARGPGGRPYPEPNPRLSVTKPRQTEPWMGPSVYSIAEKFPSNVTCEGVVGMAHLPGEWVSDYFARRHSRKDKIDPTGPKEPICLPYDHPPYRVLRQPEYWMTERQPGFEVLGDAGVYGFRVLMEVEGARL